MGNSPSKARTEKERRDEMGLSFLNDLNKDETERLIASKIILFVRGFQIEVYCYVA